MTSFASTSQLFVQGGPLMWPILACSVLGLAVFCERLWHFRQVRAASRRLEDQVLPLAGTPDQRRDALALCRADDAPLARMYRVILERWGASEEALRNETTDAAARESLLLERFLGLLSTLATLAPLLGLLGTVLGMIQAFQVIAAEGGGTPATLGQGISQALITTAAGLSVAIPLVLLHRYLLGRLDRLLISLNGSVLALLRRAVQNP